MSRLKISRLLCGTTDYSELFKDRKSFVDKARYHPDTYLNELRFYIPEKMPEFLIPMFNSLTDNPLKKESIPWSVLLRTDNQDNKFLQGYDIIFRLYQEAQRNQYHPDMKEIRAREDLCREISYQLLLQGWPIMTRISSKGEKPHYSLYFSGPHIPPHPFIFDFDIATINYVINKGKESSPPARYGWEFYSYLSDPVIPIDDMDWDMKFKLEPGDPVRVWLFLDKL